MTPQHFPEANIIYGPPDGFEESQVSRIPAYMGKCEGGSCDGQVITVVVWKPHYLELQKLNEGGAIYLSMFGVLAPHMMTTDFHQATHPA